MLKRGFYQSSIGKKQIVAVTGLVWVLFLIGHLAGNLFIFGGAEAYNGYAEKLAHLRPGLYVIETGIALVLAVHIWFTVLLVLDNIRARGGRYAVQRYKGKSSWSTRLMPISGLVIITFVIIHLKDFTFMDHNGPRSFFADGKSYGLYGVVVNSFADPLHSALYITAMFCLAMHLSHGVQSMLQTFGFNHPRYSPLIQTFSNWFALLIAVGYSSIPVYVLFSLNTMVSTC